MSPELESLLEDFASDLSRVQEIATMRFQRIVESKLREWRERFPRHAFKAWEGHGMLSIDVHPPIAGFQYGLEFMNAKDYRGAVAELISEAVEIVDAFNESEQKACISLYDVASAGWPSKDSYCESLEAVQ
jgi:hypothetical protein